MVGVIVDSHRMHVTKDDWQELLVALARIVGRSVNELHTRDFYSGNGIWRGLPGPERARIISEVFQWLAQRRHHIVYTAVDKAAYYTTQKAGHLPPEVGSLWRFLGLHLLLSVQKAHQTASGTKGNTIFIFDNEERERMRFIDLVSTPPAWTDSYYGKKKKQARLDQVVDVPYFGDSQEVHLLQVADFFAYFLRRHAEITAGYANEKYTEEASQVAGWISILRERSLPARIMYPAVGRCEAAALFHDHAPEVIRNLQRA
jgi:hypothetical protein